jgi:hypothetical protein
VSDAIELHPSDVQTVFAGEASPFASSAAARHAAQYRTREEEP